MLFRSRPALVRAGLRQRKDPLEARRLAERAGPESRRPQGLAAASVCRRCHNHDILSCWLPQPRHSFVLVPTTTTFFRAGCHSHDNPLGGWLVRGRATMARGLLRTGTEATDRDRKSRGSGGAGGASPRASIAGLGEAAGTAASSERCLGPRVGMARDLRRRRPTAAEQA